MDKLVNDTFHNPLGFPVLRVLGAAACCSIALLLASCSGDTVETGPQDIEFCVRQVWHNGRTAPSAPSARFACQNAFTRAAFTTTNLLAPGTGDLVIDYDDYPAEISVSVSNGDADFTLDKGAAQCTEHTDFWRYTPSVVYKDKKVERDNLVFTASARIDDDDDPDTDDGDVLTGTANKDNIVYSATDGKPHMQLVLHHSRALLRLAFKVSERYSKLRYVKITNISLTDTPTPPALAVSFPLRASYPNGGVLTTSLQPLTYAYLVPTHDADGNVIAPAPAGAITTSQSFTIRCTYDIYDKDASTGAEHITRQGVTAENTFTLNRLLDAGSNAITYLKAGYYYDLNITLDPDYLYVLAEHDNKHITVQ